MFERWWTIDHFLLQQIVFNTETRVAKKSERDKKRGGEEEEGRVEGWHHLCKMYFVTLPQEMRDQTCPTLDHSFPSPCSIFPPLPRSFVKRVHLPRDVIMKFIKGNERSKTRSIIVPFYLFFFFFLENLILIRFSFPPKV